MKDARPCVLDSWAALAYFNGEASAEKVADIIADSKERNTPLLMSTINAGEVWYIVARRVSANDADETLVLLEKLGVKFVGADLRAAKNAASFKVKGKISYADCYAAALAEEHDAWLVTGDREFAQFAERIAIRWMA